MAAIAIRRRPESAIYKYAGAGADRSITIKSDQVRTNWGNRWIREPAQPCGALDALDEIAWDAMAVVPDRAPGLRGGIGVRFHRRRQCPRATHLRSGARLRLRTG